jgi:hypothetical protein
MNSRDDGGRIPTHPAHRQPYGKESIMLRFDKDYSSTLRAPVALLAALALICALALGACSPQGGTGKQSGGGEEYAPNPNVTVIQGELPTIEGPDVAADGAGGAGIEGSEEEALQQDRISGGSNSGAANSKNIEPLTDPLIEPRAEREASGQ